MITGKTKFLCAGQRVALRVATLGGTCDALSTISWATIPVTRGGNSLPDDEAIAPCLDPIAGRA